MQSCGPTSTPNGLIAINLIADPDWDHERFRIVREWGVELPEVINISVNTPYPGTESWTTEGSRVASRDYRLYDIQHAVLPTRLSGSRSVKPMAAVDIGLMPPRSWCGHTRAKSLRVA
jgi:hypothetical protein